MREVRCQRTMTGTYDPEYQCDQPGGTGGRRQPDHDTGGGAGDRAERKKHKGARNA